MHVARISRTVARVLARTSHASNFGALPNGTQTVSDVKDLLANWDPRMQQLNAQAQGVAGIGDDFESDLAALNNRYNAAAGAARKAISDSGWDPVPESLRPMQDAYTAITGALKQVPGTVTKGDFDDLSLRLTSARSAAGQQTAFTTVQPTTQDVGMDFYKETSGWDVLSWLTGDQRPPWAPDPKDPLAKLEWLILLASLGLGGVFTARLVVAPALKAVAGLAGTIIGGYAAYKGTKAVGSALATVEGSTAGKMLGA